MALDDVYNRLEDLEAELKEAKEEIEELKIDVIDHDRQIEELEHN